MADQTAMRCATCGDLIPDGEADFDLEGGRIGLPHHAKCLSGVTCTLGKSMVGDDLVAEVKELRVSLYVAMCTSHGLGTQLADIAEAMGMDRDSEDLAITPRAIAALKKPAMPSLEQLANAIFTDLRCELANANGVIASGLGLEALAWKIANSLHEGSSAR